MKVTYVFFLIVAILGGNSFLSHRDKKLLQNYPIEQLKQKPSNEIR